MISNLSATLSQSRIFILVSNAAALFSYDLEDIYENKYIYCPLCKTTYKNVLVI